MRGCVLVCGFSTQKRESWKASVLGKLCTYFPTSMTWDYEGSQSGNYRFAEELRLEIEVNKVTCSDNGTLLKFVCLFVFSESNSKVQMSTVCAIKNLNKMVEIHDLRH